MRLERATQDLLAGCLDCLNAAYRAFLDLRDEPAVSGEATDGAVRAAVLIALREAELGLRPSRQGQPIAAGVVSTPTPEQAQILPTSEALASGDYTRLMREQAPWVEAFRGRVDGDPTSAYLWLSLACGPAGFAVPERNLRSSVVATTSAVPLVSFKLAAGCTPRNRAALEALLEREPRFVEIHYVLGIIALAGEGQPNQGLFVPNLEVADAHYQAAYDWRPDWPALTQAIANLAMTAEDFGRAHEFYERTLALVPDNADAMVGGIRALTYGGLYDEAIAAANRMLTTDRSPGEALYWRAFNESLLNRDNDAWTDIEQAAVTLINADVPKLAGIVAVKRRDFEVARERLALSLGRRSTDCETRFYFQAVVSEQRDWKAAAMAASESAACFDGELARLDREIAGLRTADMPEARRNRWMARREAEVAGDTRMRATAWFNASAAYFNLSRKDDARRFAEKLVGDQAFDARAREILDRLNAP